MCDVGWHELVLILILVLAGIGAVCATDRDGSPPSEHEWGTGSLTP